MAFVVFDDNFGFVDLYIADTAGPGPELFAGSAAGTYGRLNAPGIELRGIDPNLGGATFVFAKGVSGCSAGAVCELTQTLVNGRYDVSAQAWQGGANTGKPLAVPLVAVPAGTWGWFQVQGIAIVSVSGATSAGAQAYWQANGVVSTTAVASKAVIGAQFASAAGAIVGTGNSAVTLSASQALMVLSRPSAQGPIS